jgi:hypothetical protein
MLAAQPIEEEAMNLRRTPVVAGIALLALVLAGCGDDKPDEAARATSFAAAVPDTNALFALVVNQDDRRVLAYVCDGKNVATWLKGQAAQDGMVRLAGGDGALVNGRIDGKELTGTVTLPGETSARPLVASAVTSPAGLYRARGEVRGEAAVGGWVVLADGRQTGAVRTSTGFTNSDDNLAKPSKPVSFIETGTDF